MIKNMEDVNNFYKDRIEWKEDEVIVPTKKLVDQSPTNVDRNKKAMSELNKKESDINFLRGDILHSENEKVSK